MIMFLTKLLTSILKILTFIMCVHCCSIAAEQDSHNKKSIQEIINRGKLVVGVCKIDQPPFYQRDKNGKLSGLDIDLANGLANGLGVKLVINEEAENWDELVTQLHEKKIDLAASFLSKTASRAKSINFSQAYVRNNQSLLLNRLRLSKAQLRGLMTLQQIFSKGSGEKLLVYEGSSYLKFAKTVFPDVDLVIFKTQKELFDALLTGEYIGLITDQLEVKLSLDDDPDLKIKLMPVSIKNHFDIIAVGVSNNDETLLNYVNTYLEENNIMIDINTIKLPSNKANDS